MTAYQCAYAFTAKWEGGLSNDAVDRGGITKYGVSNAFLRDLEVRNPRLLFSLGISLPVSRASIENLTRDQACALFKFQFWTLCDLDNLPLQMACLLFDAGVNCGMRQSVKFAQAGINDCLTEKDPLVVDGILGPITKGALIDNNSPEVWNAILDRRYAFYDRLVSRDSTQRVFLKGWRNRVEDLRLYVQEL